MITPTKPNVHGRDIMMLERILICWTQMIELLQKTKRHDKRAETQKKNTDNKCEVLANQLVDKYGRDASKFLDLSDYTFRSRLGDRKSEFEWLPSHGTVGRLWQTLKAKLDLLDNETAIALPPASEPLIAKLETSKEVCKQPIVEPLGTIEEPSTGKAMTLFRPPPLTYSYPVEWVALNDHKSLLDALDFTPDVDDDLLLSW
jgi:hypothetical protein